MADEVRWLSADEQQAWRNFITGVNLLKRVLQHELLDGHDLSHDDYGILAMLSEAPDRRLGFKELADVLHVAPAHITYRFKRLEGQGLVERVDDPDDRRRAHVHLTDAGWDRVVAAAPTHVTGVREHFLDQMTPEQLAAIGAAMGAVLRHLDACDGDVRTHT